MSTDFRALCSELTEKLHKYTSLYEGHESELVNRARAALAQPEPVAPTDSERIGAAFVMGQTGAPPSEVERLAFESWMRGHCWQVEGVWNGITYGDRDLTRISSVDVGAMQTRRMWATWRDCSALTRYGTPANTKEELK